MQAKPLADMTDEEIYQLSDRLYRERHRGVIDYYTGDTVDVETVQFEMEILERSPDDNWVYVQFRPIGDWSMTIEGCWIDTMTHELEVQDQD